MTGSLPRSRWRIPSPRPPGIDLRRLLPGVVAAVWLLPAVHPVLRPLLGVPSHLLWFVHVLAIAIAGYRWGPWAGGIGLSLSAGTVLLGERWFGMGYGQASDWATTLAMTAAVSGTNLLMLGFALAVRFTEDRRRAVASIARAALDVAPEPLMVVDLQREIQILNHAAGRLLGGAPEALVGESLDQFLRLQESDLRAATPLLGVVLRTHKQEVTTVDVRISRVSDGEHTGRWLISLRDNSEALRQAEQERRTATLAELGQILSGVAHELSNPLAGLLAHAEGLIATPALSGEQQESVAAIRHEAGRAAFIARSLLRTVRGAPPERTRMDLGSRIDRMFRVQGPILIAHGVHPTLTIAPGVPPVFASAAEVEQVVVILLVNARQALATLPNSRVELRLESGPGPTGAALVSLTVEDNGPGVPHADAERIFEPFFTTKAPDQGTGLGLALARRIARSHGGDLVYRRGSRLGGAAFTLQLPVSGPEEAQRLPRQVATTTDLLSSRILLIEDEPAISQGIARLLEREGVIVRVATTIAEARTALLESSFEVVVSDMHLPDGEGDAFYQEILTTRPELRGRWVFMSGATPSPTARAEWAHNGEAWLSKPAPFAEILEAVGSATLGDR